MLPFDSLLLWYKPLFMLALTFAETMFAFKLRKRSFFALRVVLSEATLLLAAFFFPVIRFDALWVSFVFLSLFLLSVVALKICFCETWWNVLFCAIAAYTAEHLAYNVYIVLDGVLAYFIFGVNSDGSTGLDPYVQNSITESGMSIALSLAVYAVSYFLVYWIFYYVYASRIRPCEDLHLGRTRLVLLAGVIIVIDIVFSLITQYNKEKDIVSALLERSYNFLACIFAVELLFDQLTQKETLTQLDMVKQLHLEEKRQYELTKQNIDIINIKCHDMKHQIGMLRKREGAIDLEELKEIEDAVTIYSSVVKTGNEALDVILTEKSLYCEKNRIHMMCMAQGELLDFIRPSDIYSLFGNAIDNAIEAVRDLEDSKRSIGLTVKKTNNMICVHIENFIARLPEIKNGLPVTSKKDDKYHGYGMLSMKTITEKYGGSLAIDINENIFCLNAIFPYTDRAVKTSDNDGG